jgi:hypothetical protein
MHDHEVNWNDNGNARRVPFAEYLDSEKNAIQKPTLAVQTVCPKDKVPLTAKND